MLGKYFGTELCPWCQGEKTHSHVTNLGTTFSNQNIEIQELLENKET
jgi:hypothetical protein